MPVRDLQVMAHLLHDPLDILGRGKRFMEVIERDIRYSGCWTHVGNIASTVVQRPFQKAFGVIQQTDAQYSNKKG